MIAAEPAELFRLPLYSSPQRLIDGHLSPTKGPQVARWMEKYLVHSEGDSAGLPVRLAPHQKFILDRIYEYDPATGRLLYDRVVIGMGKGGSKTEDAARIGIAELAGPVRPLRSPRVVTSAASFDQADNVFAAAKAAIEQGPLARYFDCWDTELMPKRDPGIMKRIAARGGTNDGKLPTCNIGDELHEWKNESQKNVYDVLLKSLRKRHTPRHGGIWGGQQISISTAGDDIDSLLGNLYQHGRRVASGEIVDLRFLMLWWEAPKAENEDLDDPVQLREAVLCAQPAAGPGGWRDPEEIEANFHDPTIERHRSERLDLNRWVTRPRSWIAETNWKARTQAKGFPPDGTRIVVGFKGSYNRAATALVGWTVPQDPERPARVTDEEYEALRREAWRGQPWADYGFLIRVWERENRDPDWTVPRHEVEEEVEAAMARWEVVELVCDPPVWQTEIEGWEQKYGVRFVDNKEHTRGAGVVLRFETNVGARMAPAVDSFKGDVLDPASSLRHDGSPQMARHVKNCNTRGTNHGTMLMTDVKDSPRLIDIAVAAVIARQRALHQPAPRKRGVAAGF